MSYLRPFAGQVLRLTKILADLLTANGREACKGLPEALCDLSSGYRFLTFGFSKCDLRIPVGLLIGNKKGLPKQTFVRIKHKANAVCLYIDVWGRAAPPAAYELRRKEVKRLPPRRRVRVGRSSWCGWSVG